MKGSRVASLTLAIFVVVAAVPVGFGGFTGTATATHNCDGNDMFVASVVAGLSFVGDGMNEAKSLDIVKKCAFNHIGDIVQEIKKSDANQTHVDIYQGAVSQGGLSEGYHTAQENSMNRFGAVAWSGGMAAFADCYRDGYSKAKCVTEMRSTMSDTIAIKQKNVIEESDTHIAGLDTLRNRSEMEGYLSADQVFTTETSSSKKEFDRFEHDDAQGKATNNQTVVTYQVELANSSTHQADYIVALSYDSGFNYYEEQHIGAAPPSLMADPTRPEDDYINHVVATAPNDNYENRVVYNASEYGSTLKTLNKTNTQLQDNVDKFADETWKALENGEITPEELVTHAEQTTEYASKYSDTGYYVYATAILSQLGMATPDLNKTAHMTIDYRDNLHTGLLLSDSTPEDGAWVVGQTYNASNIEGVQLFATDTGEQMELRGEFTLVEAVTRNGTEKSVVEARKTNWVTNNASETKQVLNRSQKLRYNIEQREPDGGGLVDGSLGLLPDGEAAIVIVVGLLALLVGGALWFIRGFSVADVEIDGGGLGGDKYDR